MEGPIFFVFYRYNPSLAAAVAFLVLFALTTGAHAVQLVRHKTWYFVPFVLGGLCETIGYGGRIWSATQTPNWTKDPYIVQSLLILIAPALFAASVYMILGRIIRLVDGARHSLVPLRWLTKIFVASDVLSFFMQGGGGGFLAVAKNQDQVHTGETIIVAGLFVQLVGFGLFVVVSALFHLRITKVPTAKCHEVRVPWQRYLWILYTVSTLILVRSIFRAIEYIQGVNGNLQAAEYWLYVFDAALMFTAMVLLNAVHPSSIISERAMNQLALSSLEGTEQELGGCNERNSDMEARQMV